MIKQVNISITSKMLNQINILITFKYAQINKHSIKSLILSRTLDASHNLKAPCDTNIYTSLPQNPSLMCNLSLGVLRTNPPLSGL